MYTRANTYGGWVGVDFDGTLVVHGPIETVGAPIEVMVERVRRWIENGVAVKIVTARVSSSNGEQFVTAQRRMIQEWSLGIFGRMLKVTAEKDFRMIALWDDRAVRVETNTGIVLSKEHQYG